MATTLKDDYSCVSTDYGPPAEQILIDFLPQTEILKNWLLKYSTILLFRRQAISNYVMGRNEH